MCVTGMRRARLRQLRVSQAHAQLHRVLVPFELEADFAGDAAVELEGALVGRTREQPIAVDQIEQRHWLLASAWMT